MTRERLHSILIEVANGKRSVEEALAALRHSRYEDLDFARLDHHRALPTVLGGLVDYAVVAVPTSVGYGASFEELAALLAMLNSWAPGVGVVNIDNGFGAAVFAHMMVAKISESR